MIRATRRTSRALAAFVVAATLVFASGTAPAGGAEAELPTRRVGVVVSSDALQTTFGFTDAFTRSVRKKMTSGLPTRVLVHVELLPEKGDAPVSYWVRSADIVYDLWEENFSVSVADVQGKRRTRVAKLEDAIAAAGTLQRAEVAQIGRLVPGAYRLRVIVEINPVSEEMVRNIQRWVSRPRGGRGDEGTRTNLFGEFVGHFIDRDIGRAEHTVGFVSQWFKLGRP